MLRDVTDKPYRHEGGVSADPHPDKRAEMLTHIGTRRWGDGAPDVKLLDAHSDQAQHRDCHHQDLANAKPEPEAIGSRGQDSCDDNLIAKPTERLAIARVFDYRQTVVGKSNGEQAQIKHHPAKQAFEE